MRQSRNYEALRETRHEIDERQNARHIDELHSRLEPESRQPRDYGLLRETQHQVDAAREAEPERPERPAQHPVQRSWTHQGGMVPHHGSAHTWAKQNYEIRMAEFDKSGTGREGQGQAAPERNENDPELQQARAAVEEARRREAADRARLQERERDGPGR